MASGKVVGVRFDKETLHDLEACAKADKRSVPFLVRELVNEGFPAMKARLLSKKSKHRPAKRPK